MVYGDMETAQGASISSLSEMRRQARIGIRSVRRPQILYMHTVLQGMDIITRETMNIDKAIRLNNQYKAAQATEEDKERAVAKAHDYICLGYTLLNSADIILRETEKIMSSVGPRQKYEDSFRIGESIKDLKRVISRNEIYSQHIDSIMAEENPMSYDAMRNNAYEVLRFVMLFYSRTCSNEKATNQLAAYMQRMKSNNLFSDEEIANFKMRK